jgi:hypothetical protein
MFEAPGVWNSHQFRRRSDRINAGRLADFKKLALSRLNGPALKSFIASDQAYQREVNFAYATGWALTFYLVETRPAKYCQYLARTANRPAFESYPAEERLKDFTETFGGDFAMQSAHLLRFIGDLE